VAEHEEPAGRSKPLNQDGVPETGRIVDELDADHVWCDVIGVHQANESRRLLRALLLDPRERSLRPRSPFGAAVAKRLRRHGPQSLGSL
jgi:hypothetical protein